MIGFYGNHFMLVPIYLFFKTVLPSLSVTSRNALLPSLQIGGCRDEVFCTACSMNSGAGALYLLRGKYSEKNTNSRGQTGTQNLLKN